MSIYQGTTHQPPAGKRQSATARAYHHLKREVLTCRIPPGARLLEGECAEVLGMSKTPVREALGMLVHEGLVRVRPRHGYLVADVTLADVQEMFELRRLLEPAAARLAAASATAQQLEQLRQLVRHDPSLDHEAQVEQVTAFHMALARASGSQRLAATLEHLLEECQRLFFLGLDLQAGPNRLADHGHLIDALESGDGDRADALAAAQVEASRDQVMAAVVASLTGPSGVVAPATVRLHHSDV